MLSCILQAWLAWYSESLYLSVALMRSRASAASVVEQATTCRSAWGLVSLALDAFFPRARARAERMKRLLTTTAETGSLAAAVECGTVDTCVLKQACATRAPATMQSRQSDSGQFRLESHSPCVSQSGTKVLKTRISVNFTHHEQVKADKCTRNKHF